MKGMAADTACKKDAYNAICIIWALHLPKVPLDLQLCIHTSKLHLMVCPTRLHQPSLQQVSVISVTAVTGVYNRSNRYV